jgi:hypothetical protein
MNQFEREIKENNLRKSLRVETEFDTPIENIIEKSRSGIYKDTPENRKHGRVGERYGNMINGGSSEIREHGPFKETEETIQNVINKLKQAIDGFKKQMDNDFIGTYNKNKLKEQIEDWEINLKFWEKELSKKKISKAFEEGLISKDVFEKSFGKKAELGEIRTWHGVQMKKVSNTGNPKQDWQPVKQGTKEEGEKEPDPGEGKMNEEDLKEHAKQSSESALQAAIKNSDDPTVRLIAHKELDRRKKEEAPQEEKDEFPSKEFSEGKKKDVEDKQKQDQIKKKHDLLAKHRNELEQHESKRSNAKTNRNIESERLRDKQTKERNRVISESSKTDHGPNSESYKKLKETTERHDKEWNDHLKKYDDIEKKLKDEHKQILDKHKKEKESLNSKLKESEKINDLKFYNEIKSLSKGDFFTSEDGKKVYEIKEKNEDLIIGETEDGERVEVSGNKGIKKSIQGIQYF